jgi:GT2 family glycosyltransferase
MEQSSFESLLFSLATRGQRMAKHPFVTIIVPTYNRRLLLADLFASLRAQSYPADQFEVVVVDNSSADGTQEFVQGEAAHAPFSLRYLRKQNDGPAASRNDGAAVANGSILGFIDSDCVAAPHWIEAAVKAFESGGENIAMVAGTLEPIDNLHAPVGFFRHDMPPIRTESPLYPTANIFYRKTVFDELGGFDVDFGAFSWRTPLGGEDTDLAWRLRAAGYSYHFAPDMLVEHQASPRKPHGWLLDAMRPGVIPRLVALHPSLRRSLLWQGIFFDRAQATFYLGITGVIVAVIGRRSPIGWIGILAWLPWLWQLRGHYRGALGTLRRWPVAAGQVFFLLAMFIVQSASLLLGSLRERTPVF